MKSAQVSVVLSGCALLLGVNACGSDPAPTGGTGGTSGAGNGGSSMVEAGAPSGGTAGGNTGGGASPSAGGSVTTGGAAGSSGSGTDPITGGAPTVEPQGGGGGDDACVPRTCESLSACGGQVDDGCGRTLQCPTCGPKSCEKSTELTFARNAKSSGFSGSAEQYRELYDVSCETPADCQVPCTSRGGTKDMCAATECIQSTEDYCLPATVWQNLSALGTSGEDLALDGAELVLVALPYRDQLLAGDFQFELPESAEISGIEISLRRAADYEASAADQSVRLTKKGVAGKIDRAKPQQWPAGTFQLARYGGKDDLWGETWTAEELNSGALGVALSVQYTQPNGNARAYVDLVQAKAYYRVPCD